MPHAVPVGGWGRGREDRAAIAEHGRRPVARHELEGVNKVYGTSVILAEETYRLAQTVVEARELDTVVVAGKSEPVRIYELMGRAGEVAASLQELRELYVEGLQAYRRRDWDAAGRCFAKCLELVPGDGPATVLRERCGRLSDGWLPSLCTPEEAAAGRVVIEEAAAKAERSISPEHFGMSIGYARAPIDPATARVMAARRPRSLELTPVGLPAVRQLIERFIAVGFSKFVLRPVVPPVSWREELQTLAAAVGDLQT